MLPTYSRTGGGGGGGARKSFRGREKFLIALVFLTFCFVCFCGLFYLPEFSSNRVLNVVKQFQRAGPEMFIPAPPIDKPHSHGNSHHHHQQQPGGDRDKFMAKIKEELPDLNFDRPETLKKAEEEEKEDVAERGVDNGDNGKVLQPPNQIEEQPQQQQPMNMNPVPIPGSEDQDVSVMEKRNKVREVSFK